jgi:hypothetical protein
LAGLSRLPLLAIAQQLFLLLIFSLAFAHPPVPLLGFTAVATDFIYLILVAAWGAALASGQARLRWDRVFVAVGLYLAALAISALASDDLQKSVVKLLTQLYLLSLPVIGASLIEDDRDLRRALLWWLGGAAVVALLAITSLFLFFVDPQSSLLAITVNEFGTLPPGPYPRLRVTFIIANMLCNYLTVAIFILFAVRHRGWMGRRIFALLLAGLLISAFFTLSPGLGGVLLGLGLWWWLALRESRPNIARLGLVSGLAVALLALVLMSFTPIVHPTAPFVIRIAILDLTLAPSVRLMVWIDALRNFLADPLLGRGIGNDTVHVLFQIPSGDLRLLTDAHNSFLSIAVQCGIVGLAALLYLNFSVAARSRPLRLETGGTNAVRLALGLAFLNCLSYQGLGGSFEDARHLWVLLGLFIAARRIEIGERPTSGQAPDPNSLAADRARS